jgi:hypothetical protein
MRTILLICAIIAYSECKCQNNNSKSNDYERLKITVLKCQNVEGMSSTVENTVNSKINAVITKNNLAGISGSRFILIPNISIESKNILSSAPVKYIYIIDLFLYIGDGVDGTLFSSTSIRLKGVGESDTKAYIDAFNGIDTKSSKLQDFIQEGKNKIIQYYNAKCDILISEAKASASEANYDLALSQLSSIPDICLDCSNKSNLVIEEVFKQKINTECKTYIINAKEAWAVSMDNKAAEKAGEFLKKINPNSECYNDAVNLSNQIAEKIKETENREWDLKLKQEQNDIDLKKELIKAARDVGVAYGENQPKNLTYNYVHWW